MNLLVYKLDDEEEKDAVANFTIGETVIGRGMLACNDKRVSRNHAILSVSEDLIYIKPIHVNPTFFMSNNSKTIVILEKDKEKVLGDGDKFGLIADMFWFKVRLVKVKAEENTSQNGGLVEEEIEEEGPSQSKKIRLSSNQNGNELNGIEIKKEIKEEGSEETKSDLLEPKVECNNNQEANTSNDTPKTSTNPVVTTRRERCWYAPGCYRKNAKHKEDFSHPGDEDYDSDPNDNRPTCSFDSACYRRNILHRRQYKHSNKPAPRPNGKGKRKTIKVKKRQEYDDDEEDDYDLEDPFIDDSSDEYEMSEEDSDSDFEAPEEPEDSQELKRTLREARKFTKK